MISNVKLIASAIALAVSLLLMNDGPVVAQDTSVIFTSKDWLVRHEYYVETGNQACAARTSSRRADILDFTIWEDANHTVYIFMNNAPWRGDFRDDLKLHVDYQRWTLNNASFSSDGTVQFSFSDIDKLFSFLGDVAASRYLALKTPNERENIASWSLSGSRAAILQLFECYERIKDGGSDQYGSSHGSQYGE